MGMGHVHRYPSNSELRFTEWDWVTHDQDGRGHRQQNRWRDRLDTGRVLEGEATRLQGGIWHVEVRCVNDPLHTSPMAVDVRYKDHGIVWPGIDLIRKWRAMPPIGATS